MEKPVIMISGTAEEIAEAIQKIIETNPVKVNSNINFESDRLTRSQVRKLLNVSFPTLKKYIDSGLIPIHGNGKKAFFFRSEIIEAIKNMPSKE